MQESLGERLRKRRLEKRLGLREAAAQVKISATYLSRIETMEERNPPAEKVIQALAALLDEPFDELMTLAGRIPEDISPYLTSDPGMPDALRTARDAGLSSDEIRAALEQHIKARGMK